MHAGASLTYPLVRRIFRAAVRMIVRLRMRASTEQVDPWFGGIGR